MVSFVKKQSLTSRGFSIGTMMKEFNPIDTKWANLENQQRSKFEASQNLECSDCQVFGSTIKRIEFLTESSVAYVRLLIAKLMKEVKPVVTLDDGFENRTESKLVECFGVILLSRLWFKKWKIKASPNGQNFKPPTLLRICFLNYESVLSKRRPSSANFQICSIWKFFCFH